MRIFILLAFSILLIFIHIDLVEAENRVALVIGNNGYSAVPALSNAIQDAKAISDEFKKLGFTKVTLATDLSYNSMSDALKRFSADADNADWAVIYYAGHGIELGGTNYLIPVDARLQKDRDVELETIDLNRVMLSLSGAKQLRLVILDACRNNPFANKMARTICLTSALVGLI